MTLDFFILKSFRLYETLELQCHPGINLICGTNGTGKTSLLEAFSVLFSGFSFKKSQDRYLIRNGGPGYYLAGRIRNREGEFRMEAGFSRAKGKELILDHKKISSLKDLILRFPFLSFSPDDREMISGEPELRRRFFDRLISYLEPLYYEDLIRYNRLLKQRNTLLREKSLDNMDFWELELCRAAEKIQTKRQEILLQFNAELEKSFLPQGAEGLSFSYARNPAQNSLEEALRESRHKDLKSGFTSQGPHRDDYLLRFPMGLFKYFGSQGQMKTLAFYFKLTSAKFFSRRLGEKPVLLVDDIFAELDHENRSQILRELEALECQTFITSVRGEGMERFLKTAHFYFETRPQGNLTQGDLK